MSKKRYSFNRTAYGIEIQDISMERYGIHGLLIAPLMELKFSNPAPKPSQLPAF